MSNATEKMGKIRTLHAHEAGPLGGHGSPGGAFHDMGGEAKGWVDKDEQTVGVGPVASSCEGKWEEFAIK